MIVEETLQVTTDASGAADVSTNPLNGKLISIQYVVDGTSPYDNTVDLTVTNKSTGESLLSQTNIAAAFKKFPRVATQDTSGNALLYAAGGTAQSDYLRLCDESVRIVLAQGGNAKTGQFIIQVER